MTAETQTERQEILERIWLAEARALATILEDTPAKEITAAVLSAARQFLSDQGIRLETLNKDQRRGAARGYAAQIAEAVKADEQAPLPEPGD